MLPNNEKNPAAIRMQVFVDAANRQYTNAINVQAMPYALYRKERGKGMECSCYKATAGIEPTQLSVDPVTQRGSTRTIEVTAYGVDPLRKLAIPEMPVPDELEAGLIDFVNDGVFGGDTTVCGVCFGTGHVGGYSYYSGLRITLDVQGASVTVGGLDDSVRPFATLPDTVATWTFRRPQYYTTAAVSLYNNDKLLPDIPTILENGAPIDLALVNPPAASTTCTISSPHPFTHVVLLFEFAQRVMLSTSSVSYVRDPLNENISGELTVVAPPSVYFYPEDVLVDTFNRIWEVESVEESRLSNGILVNSSVTCTVVQPWDVKRILRDRIKLWG